MSLCLQEIHLFLLVEEELSVSCWLWWKLSSWMSLTNCMFFVMFGLFALNGANRLHLLMRVSCLWTSFVLDGIEDTTYIIADLLSARRCFAITFLGCWTTTLKLMLSRFWLASWLIDFLVEAFFLLGSHRNHLSFFTLLALLSKVIVLMFIIGVDILRWASVSILLHYYILTKRNRSKLWKDTSWWNSFFVLTVDPNIILVRSFAHFMFAWAYLLTLNELCHILLVDAVGLEDHQVILFHVLTELASCSDDLV